ncbi:MAG: CinA family nicotinamide mononucleotide deamidase-related protein [Anaerolineaceae bacterium]|nr:CinA family nicotinamide mononucleotide deamidase-related protein [Anaerolineaceae bacterium]
MEHINAEIISIGTEILLGEITDTNSVFIARTLRDVGVNVYYMSSVGDNEQRISDVIRAALARVDVVITCGGLGPTVDDMTRQGVAAATGRGLTFHQNLFDAISERFANFKVRMTPNNARQAYLPDDALLIENPVGTAPCFIVEYQENKAVISLPGVPREMKYLMIEAVIPYLKRHYNLQETIIKARVLRTAGIGESTLDSRIGDDLLQQSNPTVGLAAHAGQVDVRITAKATSVEIANRMIDEVEAILRERIGTYVFGIDNERIEGVLVQLLTDNQVKVGLLQAGVGDVIGTRIREVDSSGQVIASSEVYTSPGELQAKLGIGEGVSLRDLAEKAAEGAAQQSPEALGMAVVSHPEMGEDHDDSESGTAIAVYFAGQKQSRVYGFGGQSEVAPEWTSTWAMSMAWRMLKEKFAE